MDDVAGIRTPTLDDVAGIRTPTLDDVAGIRTPTSPALAPTLDDVAGIRTPTSPALAPAPDAASAAAAVGADVTGIRTPTSPALAPASDAAKTAGFGQVYWDAMDFEELCRQFSVAQAMATSTEKNVLLSQDKIKNLNKLVKMKTASQDQEEQLTAHLAANDFQQKFKTLSNVVTARHRCSQAITVPFSKMRRVLCSNHEILDPTLIDLGFMIRVSEIEKTPIEQEDTLALTIFDEVMSCLKADSKVASSLALRLKPDAEGGEAVLGRVSTEFALRVSGRGPVRDWRYGHVFYSLAFNTVEVEGVPTFIVSPAVLFARTRGEFESKSKAAVAGQKRGRK